MQAWHLIPSLHISFNYNLNLWYADYDGLQAPWCWHKGLCASCKEKPTDHDWTITLLVDTQVLA